MSKTRIFNPPPGWPEPPVGWLPAKGWSPDPSWPSPPAGWQLWIDAEPIDTGASSPPPKGDIERSALALQADVAPSSRLAELEAENANLREQIAAVSDGSTDVVELDDQRVLQAVGIYRYHHPLENAVAFRERLEEIEARITAMVTQDGAIEVSKLFTFEGSLAKGRRMTADMGKLMLRAYNAEAENVVRALRAGSVQTAVKRLDSARAAIARLGRMMEMKITDSFHLLRIEEIELTADYLMKKEEEREAARAERERLREERKVEQELSAARERLEKERTHLITVIDKLKTAGRSDQNLEEKLAGVETAIVRNDFQAANIRAGYVYVISNRGALGEHVVKIGLTRRQEPRERIAELGDASVPFKFDVHAIYYSSDAVRLEHELHDHFAERRMNWANNRREFFFASPAEVRSVLSDKVGNLLEFVETVESAEYLQSVRCWPDQFRHPVRS